MPPFGAPMPKTKTKTIPNPLNGKPLEIKADQKIGSIWTEARIIDLVHMWAEGLSTARIAGILSIKVGQEVTRNAVIGRLSRMKLTSKARMQEKRFAAKQRSKKKRQSAIKRAGKEMRSPRQMAQWPPKAGTPHPPLVYEEVFREVIVPAAQQRKLSDLDEHQCRWPIGDPLDSDFHFCGARRMPGGSYCTYHQAASCGIYDGVPAPWPTRQLKTKKKVPEPA